MDEKSIIQTIQNENLSNEELTELYWLLNKDQYKERPVTIQEFIQSDDFVHKKWPNIFPIWQEALADLYPNPFIAPYNEVLISAAAGSGKCLIEDTPILMYDQTVKMIQDIIPGDIIMGDDNTPRNVLNTDTGNELCYKVILEDGSWFGCNKSHILSLRNEFTGNIININIEEYLKQKTSFSEYFAYKYNDNKLYNFKIEEIGNKDYYGFTIDGNHLFTLDNGIVTHNTVTATISIIYDIYKLGCLKDPCRFYGLTPDTMIIMAIFSATGSTAAVNWNEITTGISSCPWIMDKLVDKQGFNKKNGSIVPVEIIPGIYIQTGSKFQHSMGKAIFDGLMDEAAFGGANMKDAQKSYNELSSRIKTRFANWGTKGNTPGHLFLISSPKEAGDFMQYRIEKTQEADSSLTKIMQNISTWEADPRKDSDDKFTVFIGNENKEPCMYDPNEEVPLEEMDYLIYPPMRFYEDFKKDLLISIMNYGGIATTSDMALFKSVTALNDVFVLQNPFKSDVIELPFSKTDKTLMDFADIDYFKNGLRHPENNRFIHIDAAYSTNTLDVYGFGATYSIFMDNSTYTSGSNSSRMSDDIVAEDIFTKRDRMYITDFIIGITAPKGEEVPLYKVQDFIEWLNKIGYPIASVSADQFQSKQTLQNLQVKGFETENISVDRTRDPYLFLRHLVYNKQILLPKNEYLKGELRKLRDDGRKIDHPTNCFVGDTKIQLVDGRNVSILDLIEEHKYKQNWVYTFNEKNKKIEPKRIKNIWQTKITKDLVKVTLDNGEVIICTPNHQFMLRDGSYEEIQNLTIGVSLMPLYTKISNTGLSGYRLYYEPMEDMWHYEHRQFGNPTKEKSIIHHCNYNKLDNTPVNLKSVTRKEHTIIHNNQTMDYSKVSDAVKQWHARIKGTPEQKQISEKISKKVIDSLTDEQKQKRQRKAEFRKGLEQHFNVIYNNLDAHEKGRLIAQYIRFINPEIDKHHSKALKQAHEDGKYAHRKGVPLNRYWVTDGVVNKYIPTNVEIPLGFRKGRTFSKETLAKMKKANSHEGWTFEQKQAYVELQRELSSNRIWITNGKEDKYIKKDSIIPEGFKLGRCKIGKNHKITSIEYITKPCKVYDLEIEDNHNFALSAGVFVHNCHKDLGDSVAGSTWACANSDKVINTNKIIRQYYGGGSASNNGVGGGRTYTPEQQTRLYSPSNEILEYSQIKQNMANIFKGL